MNPEEIRAEGLEEVEEMEAAEEIPTLDPPKFSVNTVINAKIQQEASQTLATKSAKIVSYVCFALVVVAFGLLIWQYVIARTSTNLIMMILCALVLVYLAYSHLTMPKKALARWESSLVRTYGSAELHLTTEFYNLSLAQTVKEDGSVNVQGYSELSELRESEHLFLLRRSKQQWFFLAKDGFTTGTADEFRAFIKARLEGK